MNDRASQILEAAIQEFIDTGEPVSSGWLYKKYDFGIKPAMIRLELDALEDDGYLEQPYHSAGRVPTDGGYEFYAERALAARAGARIESQAMALRRLLERRSLDDLMHQLSHELGLMSVAVDRAADEIYKTGLEALFNNLDLEDRKTIQSVIRDFEGVEKLAEKFGDHDPAAGLRVFIGKKSPVTESENLSVVCNTYRVGNATVSIFAIGPKRMDYKKVITVFRNL